MLAFLAVLAGQRGDHVLAQLILQFVLLVFVLQVADPEHLVDRIVAVGEQLLL